MMVVPGYKEIDTLDGLEGGCPLILVICRHGGGGGGCTISIIDTVAWLVPVPVVRVKVIVSLYEPAVRLAIETLTLTSCVAPAFRLLLGGLLIWSQGELLAVVANQEPEGPQLVRVTDC